MDSHKLALKLFVEDASQLKGDEFVPVFHSWIQQHKVANHLTIDVADYGHVHNGPGTVLITSEANFAADREGGRLGLLYIRKKPFPGTETFAERLRATARPLFEAVQRLEQDPLLLGKIKFRTNELLFRIYDRLLGPADAETFAQVKGDVERFVTDVYGAAPTALKFTPSAESLFEISIQIPRSPDVGTLLARLPDLQPAMS